MGDGPGARFAGREPRTLADIHAHRFRPQGIAPEVVEEVWQVLATEFDIDPSRLRAEDAFSQHLRVFFDGDSMLDVEIVLALEKHFAIAIRDEEAEALRTVADVVMLVARKTSPDGDAHR